jgi:alpha-L-fucosidase
MIQTKPTPGDTTWFTHDRFGMFIHWGLYALPARHEWIRHYEQISNETYEVYFKHFDPDLYNPEIWASAAENAGMKYFVITTKHHEGFCLWDSEFTDYKATNTPAKRDLLHPMVDAFRRHNLHTGFYHSLIDWHHPDFLIDDNHPLRNNPDRAKLNAGRDQKKYAKYLHNQVRELLTEFGKIDVLWFDFSYPHRDPNGVNDPTRGKGHEDWDSENLYKMIRELQPHVILDDRLDLPEGWDIKTPEQYQPLDWVRINGQPVVWEACQTFSGSWGYHRDEASWKSIDQLIQMLINTVSNGGNLLLNVGPTGRGEFDARALDRLQGMGDWMKYHSRSIYGCTQAPKEFEAPQDCRYTYNPETKRLYLHIFAWPFQHLHLKNLAGKVEYAQLLNDASEIKFGMTDWFTNQMKDQNPEMKDLLTLNLPVEKPNVTVPVIELFLK